jgi:hypothetical protein
MNFFKLFSTSPKFGVIMLILAFAINIGNSQTADNNAFVGAIKADVETVMKAAKSMDKFLSIEKENNNSSNYYSWVIAEFGSVAEANAVWNRLRANTQQHFTSNKKANVGAQELKEFYLEISGIIRKTEPTGSIPGPTFCHDKFVEDNYLALSESFLAGSAYSGIADGESAHILRWVKANADFEKCIEVNY